MYFLSSYFLSVGRNADVCRIHWHRANNGLGQQSHRDPLCRIWTPRRRVHAQESTTTQVLMWAQRQSILFLSQRRILLSDILHDSQQAGYGQLVVPGSGCCERAWTVMKRHTTSLCMVLICTSHKFSHIANYWPFEMQRLVIVTDYYVLKRQSTNIITFEFSRTLVFYYVAFCTEDSNVNTNALKERI